MTNGYKVLMLETWNSQNELTWNYSFDLSLNKMVLHWLMVGSIRLWHSTHNYSQQFNDVSKILLLLLREEHIRQKLMSTGWLCVWQVACYSQAILFITVATKLLFNVWVERETGKKMRQPLTNELVNLSLLFETFIFSNMKDTQTLRLRSGRQSSINLLNCFTY